MKKIEIIFFSQKIFSWKFWDKTTTTKKDNLDLQQELKEPNLARKEEENLEGNQENKENQEKQGNQGNQENQENERNLKNKRNQENLGNQENQET